MEAARTDRPKGRLERLSYERHERDLERAGGAGPDSKHPEGLWFDEGAADRVVDFFEKFLCHWEGEKGGQPFLLEPWQAFILRCVFGWKRPDGRRRFRTAYVEVPRKNGKTVMAAGVGLYMLVADGESGAQVYSSATKKDQAKIAWRNAKEMVKRSEPLNELVTKRRNTLSVTETASKFEPVGADADTLDGLNAHANIVDEVHAHKDREVYDVLDDSMGARSEPLTLMITTAGEYRPEGFGWQEHEYAEKVLEGSFDPQDETYFALIAHADESDDWTEPETWEKANPNLGVSLNRDKVEEKCRKAQRQPSYTNNFLRQYLNIWTEQKDRWIPMEAWDRCGGEIDEEALVGRTCYGGLDLASTRDINAFLLSFPPQSDGERWKLVCRFWVPRETVVERSEIDRVPYDAWVRDGHMLDTPGNVADYDEIHAEIVRLNDRYDIQEVGFDPWNATQLALELGKDGVQMVKMRQSTAKMSEPTTSFEKLFMAKPPKLNHGDHPVLRWMASNISMWQDSAGNIRPDKGGSAEKIDGIVAAVMAVGRATLHEGEGGSPYEDHEMVVL